MAFQKCSCIALILMALLSLSICSAHRLQTSTFPNMAEAKNAEPDPEIPDDIAYPTEARNGDLAGGGGVVAGLGDGDAKWAAGGGWGGVYGRGGGGGGWNRGDPIIPRLPPPRAGEPLYCRPISCGDPYACPGFTLYLNRLAIASYMSKDVHVGRHQYDGDVDVMAPESG